MVDDVGKIIGAVISIFATILIISILGVTFSNLGEQQCQPYKDTIAQKDADIINLNQRLNETENLLEQCRGDYNKLINENITNQDIEEIKGYYNLTQIQINNLNQKFQETNNNYFSFYKILLKNYRLSLTFNIAIAFSLLSIEVLSLIFLKSEFIMFIINAILKHKRKKREDE